MIYNQFTNLRKELLAINFYEPLVLVALEVFFFLFSFLCVIYYQIFPIKSSKKANKIILSNAVISRVTDALKKSNKYQMSTYQYYQGVYNYIKFFIHK